MTTRLNPLVPRGTGRADEGRVLAPSTPLHSPVPAPAEPSPGRAGGPPRRGGGSGAGGPAHRTAPVKTQQIYGRKRRVRKEFVQRLNGSYRRCLFFEVPFFYVRIAVTVPPVFPQNCGLRPNQGLGRPGPHSAVVRGRCRRGGRPLSPRTFACAGLGRRGSRRAPRSCGRPRGGLLPKPKTGPSKSRPRVPPLPAAPCLGPRGCLPRIGPEDRNGPVTAVRAPRLSASPVTGTRPPSVARVPPHPLHALLSSRSQARLPPAPPAPFVVRTADVYLQ